MYANCCTKFKLENNPSGLIITHKHPDTNRKRKAGSAEDPDEKMSAEKPKRRDTDAIPL